MRLIKSAEVEIFEEFPTLLAVTRIPYDDHVWNTPKFKRQLVIKFVLQFVWTF